MSPRGIFRRLARDARGVTATEFGLIATPLMVLLMGGFDVGHQAYIRSVMQGALADVARKASVQDADLTASGDTTEERIANTIKAQLKAITPGATITVTESNFYDFSGIGNPEKLMTDVNGNGAYDAADDDCFSDLNENGKFDTDTGRDGIGGANDVVFYQARIVMPRLFPVEGLLGLSPNYDMTVSTAVRNQPYGTQKTPPVVCGA